MCIFCQYESVVDHSFAGSTLDNILVDYLREHSPVNASIEGRIVRTTETQQHLPGLNNMTNGNGKSADISTRLTRLFTTTVIMVVCGLVLLGLP